MTYEVIDSENVFNSFIKVKRDKLKLPNGNLMDYYYVDHQDAVIIIAKTDSNKFVMVKQYRHSNKKTTLEFPVGLIDEGEKPIVAAKRELEEETGYVADRFAFLGDYFPQSGSDSMRVHIYLATGLSKKEQKLDPEEFIEVVEFSESQFRTKILERSLKEDDGDALCCMGTILAYYLYKDFIYALKDDESF